MKRALALTAILGAALLGASPATAIETNGSVGVGHGIAVPGPDENPCAYEAVDMTNFDGTAENGYCWQYGGIVPPYYGAFAECFEAAPGFACGIDFWFTGIGYPCRPLDAYIWDDAGGMPGNVLQVTSGLNPCPVATWPNISRHDFAIPELPVDGAFWAGYWADYSTAVCGYFVAADLDGFGGCPFTNIAPGIGYPTGWNNVSTVWGPTVSIGISIWIRFGTIPTEETSWGSIKALYK